MDKEIKRMAARQWLKYFWGWFVVVGVVVALTMMAVVGNAIMKHRPRGNRQCDQERVFDYADILTDAQEEDLRRYIARYEQKAHLDVVIVTIDQPMGRSDAEWENNMMNTADDMYDEGGYGWNRAHGDGVLLLDNWYEDENGSQKGTWLSSSGRMEMIIGAWEENEVLDRMYEYVDKDPLTAYKEAVRALAGFSEYGEGDDEFRHAMEDGHYIFSFLMNTPVLMFEFGVTVIALIYGFSNMVQSKAKDTTTASTYVESGKPNVRAATDTFLRKSVTKHRIESSGGGGGGGGGHRGGGSHGSHRSSGGHSHGGGGRRR